MSLQSTASVPPAPLMGGSLNVRTSQVTEATKNMGKLILPNSVAPVDGPAVTALNYASTAGQMLFVTTVGFAQFDEANKLYVYSGTAWEKVTSA